MKIYHLPNSKLIIHDNHLELQLLHECHFDAELFKHSFKIKMKYFGNNKVGVIVVRKDLDHTYSYDPSILIENKNILESHAKWVSVISVKLSDLQNLEYVKMLTKVPCYVFENHNEFAEHFSNNI